MEVEALAVVLQALLPEVGDRRFRLRTRMGLVGDLVLEVVLLIEPW